MTRQSYLAILLVLGALGTPGCLPADLRPEPARIYVTTDLQADVRAKQTNTGQLVFSTDDGWTITLTRLFVSMGGLGFSGDSCNEYSEARYWRVLDLQQAGPQKVAQIWGLNSCQISYGVSRPNSTAVLGTAITQSDHDFMQNAWAPASSATGITTKQGIAMQVVGTAAKATTAVSFDLGFADKLGWENCQRRISGELEPSLPLVGGETVDVNIEVDPRALFVGVADTTDPTLAPATTPLMQLIADADQLTGNANGRIGVDELITVAMPSAISDLNLAEYLRQKAYPAMFRYAGDGQCTKQEAGRRGPGGGGN